MEVMMALNRFVPSLRMVITSNCNGKCKFCHHEGYLEQGDMSVSLASDIAKAARKLNIPCICITGGEPTLHPQLFEIISEIQRIGIYDIALTTNGCNLLELSDKVEKSIQKLNVSITSFDPIINQKYQDVEVDKVKNAILKFPSDNKNFNVVINSDNYEKLDEIISFCELNSIDLDLLFEMNENNELDFSVEKQVVKKIESLGQPIIIPGCPSHLTINTQKGVTIRIKHPKISALLKRNICENCNNSTNCLEKVCSVRVYPDGGVSPCLSRYYYFNQSNVEENIFNAYQLFEQDENLLQSLFY